MDLDCEPLIDKLEDGSDDFEDRWGVGRGWLAWVIIDNLACSHEIRPALIKCDISSKINAHLENYILKQDYTSKKGVSSEQEFNWHLMSVFPLYLKFVGSNHSSLQAIIAKSDCLEQLEYMWTNSLAGGNLVDFINASDGVEAAHILCDNIEMIKLLISKHNLIYLIARSLQHKSETKEEQTRLISLVCSMIHKVYKHGPFRHYFELNQYFNDSEKQKLQFWDTLSDIDKNKNAFEGLETKSAKYSIKQIYEIIKQLFEMKLGKEYILDEKESDIDELTKLKLRKSLKIRLREITEAKQTSEDAVKKGISAIIFVDIDNFRNVNEKFNHIIGDQLIAAITNIIKHIAARYNEKEKEKATAYRYGGDEFVVVVCDSDEKRMTKLATDIVSTINGVCSTTVSVGIAFYQENQHCNDWLERADIASKDSKANGKNQVTLAP